MLITLNEGEVQEALRLWMAQTFKDPKEIKSWWWDDGDCIVETTGEDGT